MNKVILMGRLTDDPNVTTGQDGNISTARYSLAVDRRYRRDGDQNTDFPRIVAFGKSAEFAAQYLKKGTKIIVTGRLQTGSYTNRDGQKVYTTDVVAEEQEFAESKSASSGNNTGSNAGYQQNGNYAGTPAASQQGYGAAAQAPYGVQPQNGYGAPAQNPQADQTQAAYGGPAQGQTMPGYGPQTQGQRYGASNQGQAMPGYGPQAQRQSYGAPDQGQTMPGYANQPQPQNQANGNNAGSAPMDDFMNIPDEVDDKLPFD